MDTYLPEWECPGLARGSVFAASRRKGTPAGRFLFALMLLRFVAEIILHRNNTFVKHFFIVVEIFLS
jgi:hypothetical protein